MRTLRLKKITDIQIVPTLPFNFDATVYKPAHFPTNDTRWESGRRWQTMLWTSYPLASEDKMGKSLGLILENKGRVSKPKVDLHVFSDKELSQDFLKSLKKEIIYRYNLDLDLEEFNSSFKSDSVLGPILKKLKGMRPMTHGSLYDYLVIAIMLQNAPVKRSISMMQSLFENYGTSLEYDEKKLYCMWPPEILAKVPEQKLRDLKVGYRAKSLLRISQQFARGEIDEVELRKKSAEEQKKTLLGLYGVGPQSVGYIMVDIFHRWDFLEHISPWEGKILSKIIFNTEVENPVSEEKLLKFFAKYGKYKALAFHYIWEDLWWKRERGKELKWLEDLIRR